MPAWSRRRALRAAAATAAIGLAGCSGDASSSYREPIDPNAEPVTDYTMEQVRTTDPIVLFWTGDNPPTDGEPGQTLHLTTAEERSDVQFPSDVPEARTLKQFIRGIDLETESVYLHSQTIQECYDLRLQGVSRKPNSLRVDMCADLKAADVACSADAEVTVGLAIRLPFPGDEFNGLGMSYGRSCDPAERPVDFDPSTPTRPTDRSEEES